MSYGENLNSQVNNPFIEIDKEDEGVKSPKIDTLNECSDLFSNKKYIFSKINEDKQNDSVNNSSKINHFRNNSFMNYSIGTNEIPYKMSESKDVRKSNEDINYESPYDVHKFPSQNFKSFNQNSCGNSSNACYNSCDSKYKSSKNLMNQFLNQNSRETPQIHCEEVKNSINLNKHINDIEERKICALEIKLLHDKLSFYNNQLLPQSLDKISDHERQSILTLIKSIQQQLENKTCDNNQFHNEKFEEDFNEQNQEKSYIFDDIKTLPCKFDRFSGSRESNKSSKDYIKCNEYVSNSKMSDPPEESRVSTSTIKTFIIKPIAKSFHL